jgi:hypothetical protein
MLVILSVEEISIYLLIQLHILKPLQASENYFFQKFIEMNDID